MQYNVIRAAITPEFQGLWDGPAWNRAGVATISHFHEKSSSHHPQAQAKLMYDDRGIYVMFRVRDRYVVCRHTEPQSPVCKDSCVEAFLQTKPGAGYFNFELNCGGAMLLYYVTDATRINGGIKGYREVESSLLKTIRIYHSMPSKLDKELEGPVDWTVEYFVPNKVFEAYDGPLEAAGERACRGNLYKCADGSSHPHWGSWAPIGEALNFHVPEFFQPFVFQT